MIELSVQISDIMSYSIKISRETRAEVFPEMMKRFKAIYTMIQKEEEKNMPPRVMEQKNFEQTEPKVTRGRPRNPMMNLSKEDSRDLIALYETSSQENFDKYLEEEFSISPPLARKSLAHLIWRIKKRMGKME